MSSVLRNHLIEELGINSFFTNCTKAGLHFLWGHYLAVIKSIEQAQTFKAGSWPSDLPTFNDILIVEVFVSRSAFYNQRNGFASIKKSYQHGRMA